MKEVNVSKMLWYINEISSKLILLLQELDDWPQLDRDTKSLSLA